MPIIRQWFTERIADAGDLIDDTVPAIRVIPVRHHGERAVRDEDYRASIAWRCLDMTGDLLDHAHLLTLARVEPFDGTLERQRNRADQTTRWPSHRLLGSRAAR